MSSAATSSRAFAARVGAVSQHLDVAVLSIDVPTVDVRRDRQVADRLEVRRQPRPGCGISDGCLGRADHSTVGPTYCPLLTRNASTSTSSRSERMVGACADSISWRYSARRNASALPGAQVGITVGVAPGRGRAADPHDPGLHDLEADDIATKDPHRRHRHPVGFARHEQGVGRQQ